MRHLRAWGETNTDLFSFPKVLYRQKTEAKLPNKRMNFVFRSRPVKASTKRDLLFSAISLVSGLTASFVFQRAEIAIVAAAFFFACVSDFGFTFLQRPIKDLSIFMRWHFAHYVYGITLHRFQCIK